MTTYNASEIDRLVHEYQDRGRDFARRGGTWLGAARSWIKRHCLNGERVTWGSNDVLQHDFTVDDVERIALEVATAMFDEFAAMVAALLAATQEVERLTRERDEARAEWQGADGKADWYVKECERLRKLVGEACEIGMAWAYVLNLIHDDPQDRTRLAAIRHAAGVDNA